MDSVTDQAPKEASIAATTPLLDGSNNRPKAQAYRSRTRVSKDLLLSRLGTFVLAVAAAVVVFLTKRYDVESLWTDQQPANLQSDHGSPTREYAVCTRNKGGIYTVDGDQSSGLGSTTTQCLVIGTDGIISETGTIGMYRP